MMDEHQCVARAQEGDVAAFEALVHRHSEHMYNLALRTVGHAEEAEDLVQEAFVRAWRNLDSFRGEARFQTWLYRIVMNLCYDRLPRLKRELNALDPGEAALHLPDEQPHAADMVLAQELAHLLHEAIDKLPDTYRLLIALRHLQEMSYNEIAEVTGLPLGTVKTGIHRARQTLRGVVEAYEADTQKNDGRPDSVQDRRVRRARNG